MQRDTYNSTLRVQIVRDVFEREAHLAEARSRHVSAMEAREGDLDGRP